MLTAQEIHEQWALHHLHAKQWDDVSAVAKRLYEALAQAIEVEKSSIIAVKCMKCNEMISAYGYSEHVCKEADNG